MAWTTTDLLADVRRRAMLPTTSTLGLADADILEHANNEMATRLVPLVTSVNEEFYVQTVDIACVSAQAAYRMPNRSAGAKLRDVTYLQGSSVQRLSRIEPERLAQFTATPMGTPVGFYLEAGTINLVPSPSGGTLRMKYFVRPGRFTNTATDYGTIATITANTANIFSGTFAGSLTTATYFDIIANRPPFEYLAIEAQQFTFSGANIAVVGGTGNIAPISLNLAVGDYICKTDKSPLIQLPVELHSLLVQRTVCAIMETFNYTERLSAAESAYERMEAAALKLITPRIDGSPKKMRGILSTGRYGTGTR